MLIGSENSMKMKTTMGIQYNDELVREKNHRLIAKRTSTFARQERQELVQ